MRSRERHLLVLGDGLQLDATYTEYGDAGEVGAEVALKVQPELGRVETAQHVVNEISMSKVRMNTGPIDSLHRWSAEHKERIVSMGIAVEYVESANEEERSAHVDLESGAVIGRATVWETGFCDLELLSVETGEQLLYQHHEEVNGARLAPLLDDIADRMSNPP